MKATTEFLDVPVDRVMTRRPDFVGAEGSIGDAAALMVWGGYRHLPVLDPDERLVGMLSERDLRARLGSEPERFADAGRQLLDDTVESVMRPDPITVGPHVRLRDVLRILLDERVGALPVTDDADRLLGIVSYVDLLAFLHEGEAAVPPKRTRRTGAPERRAAPQPAARRATPVARATKRRRT